MKGSYSSSGGPVIGVPGEPMADSGQRGRGEGGQEVLTPPRSSPQTLSLWLCRVESEL